MLRNYVFTGDLAEIPSKNFDVVIVGAGVAGLYCALNIDPRLKCAVINKLGMDESNSMFAQGGIAAVTLAEDSIEKHVQDTLTAGAGLCDPEAVRLLVSEGPKEIRHLIELGVPFDVNADGAFSVTREGAHSCNRILHCHGDATGLHITKTLQARAMERENLRLLDNLTLADILTDGNGTACGVVLADADGRCLRLNTPNVILATGGIGRVYRNSTNATAATGDGIAAAMRAGAAVADMEMVQFHPTALVHPGMHGRYFLISEALRGEGAVLRNRRWEAFMTQYHPLADLAPRDIVSRAIITEMKKYDLPHVYLDITHKSRAFLEKRFPTIYNECMKRDLDIAISWIPVIPIQHYFMGGVKIDAHARTSIEGLYACGETACSGVHGANRLASNSLLECLVYGWRAAEGITMRAAGAPAYNRVSKEAGAFDIPKIRFGIREAMTKKCGIIRNASDLTEAITEISGYYQELSASELKTSREIETLNMATVAGAVLDGALKRKNSVGAHYRSDEIKEETKKC